MDILRLNAENPQSIPQNGLVRSSSKSDFLKILWRWKWLPTLGTIIGITLGYLYFSQQPPQFAATALVQVQSPVRDLPLDTFTNSLGMRNRADELVIISSYEVLRKAVEIARLNQHPKLSTKTPDQIIGWMKSGILEVRMGSKDPNSEILSITVTTDDSELSGIVLQAVVAGYDDHVSNKLRSSASEAVRVLERFNESYEQKSSTLKQRISSLRNTPGLVWIENKPTDPASARVTLMEQEVTLLDNQKKKFQSLIEQVEDGRKASRPIEESLRLIASATNNNVVSFNGSGQENSKEKSDLKALLNSIALYEETQIVPVRMKLRLEEATWGPQHPTVASLRLQLNELLGELERKKEALTKAQEDTALQIGTDTSDAESHELQLKMAMGALRERVSAIEREKMKYQIEIDALKPLIQQNSILIEDFTIQLAELDALGKANKEVSDAMEKLSLSGEFGNKSVTKLEVANVGSFVGPNFVQFVGVGAILGAVVFYGLAYLLEISDRSYRSPDEIAHDLGMPIVGHLPLISISRDKRIDDKIDSSVVTFHKNRSPLSEAFRGIRTAVFFSTQNSKAKILQVTSPIPGDGKSTVAANLAVSISQSGRKVCIIDCDFRRPRIAKIFGLKEELGLVQVITGRDSLDSAIQSTKIENLYSITCGRRPGNPSELLSSEAFINVLAELRQKFDFVIVDTPPMLAVSDPANVATVVDGVVLTVRLRRNLKPIALRAAQMLHSINAQLIGVVVNGIGIGSTGSGYGGYRYDATSSTSGYSGGYGYGQSGYGGYGYGSTYQYGGYYGGTMIGRDYYADQVPKPSSKSQTTKTSSDS